MPAALELQDVWRVYGEGETSVVGVREASLRIEQGDTVAVVGPSGSGKSTLLQLMGLLDTPTQGSISLAGEDVTSLDDAALTRLRLLGIGFVFQRFHLLPGLSAMENVALPMEAAGWPPAERYARAVTLLGSVGLADRVLFDSTQLSGGQRQRVAIARALANEAPLILADEPTGALHSDDKHRVIDLLLAAHDQGRTIIVVTHDPDMANVMQRQIEIRDGSLSEVTAGHLT
jgi:ABC-type lipoprotein export system ATPase subunit